MLFHAHASFVWRVLRRYGVAVADIEDVCQEVFAVVYRRLAEFEGRSQLRTWLYEIARRTALSQRRRQARLPLVAELEPSAPCDEAPDNQVDKQRALAWLRWALAQLDEEKREAFVLYELEQLTLAEVARAMSCSINAVHYRVLAARKELVTLSRRGARAVQLGEQGGVRKVAGAQSREGV